MGFHQGIDSWLQLRGRCCGSHPLLHICPFKKLLETRGVTIRLSVLGLAPHGQGNTTSWTAAAMVAADPTAQPVLVILPPSRVNTWGWCPSHPPPFITLPTYKRATLEQLYLGCIVNIKKCQFYSCCVTLIQDPWTYALWYRFCYLITHCFTSFIA